MTRDHYSPNSRSVLELCTPVHLKPTCSAQEHNTCMGSDKAGSNSCHNTPNISTWKQTKFRTFRSSCNCTVPSLVAATCLCATHLLPVTAAPHEMHVTAAHSASYGCQCSYCSQQQPQRFESLTTTASLPAYTFMHVVQATRLVRCILHSNSPPSPKPARASELNTPLPKHKCAHDCMTWQHATREYTSAIPIRTPEKSLPAVCQGNLNGGGGEQVALCRDVAALGGQTIAIGLLLGLGVPARERHQVHWRREEGTCRHCKLPKPALAEELQKKSHRGVLIYAGVSTYRGGNSVLQCAQDTTSNTTV